MNSPSKKIISLSIICLAILVSVFIFKLNPQSKNLDFVLTTVSPNIVVDINTTDQSTDLDNDGLKDWEEVLWGTDSNNSDSDGDKTPDGEEVALDRDPKIPGPNDKIGNVDISQKLSVPNIYESFVKDSVTDSVSQDLFSYYIQTKEESGFLDSGDFENIAEYIAGDVFESNLLKDKYSIDSIGVFSDSDIVAVEKYANDFGRIYLDFVDSVDNSPEELEYLAPLFVNLSKSLVLIKAPNSLKSTHLEIVNNFYNSAVAMIILNDYEKDPVKASVSAQIYRSLEDRRPQLFTTIGTYILRSDIIFDNEDIESLWQNI
jgi:hypothetical protein